MMKILFSFLILSFCSLEVEAYPWPAKSSFALTCWSPNQPYPLMPLNFFEFKDTLEDLTIKPNYVLLLKKISPKLFSSYEERAKKAKLIPFPLPYADFDRYDSLIVPPVGCGVLTMLQEGIDGPNLILFQQDTWTKLSREYQDFFLFDYHVQFFLKEGLARSDYRKFSLYVATNEIGKFSEAERNEFLKFYGIKN